MTKNSCIRIFKTMKLHRCAAMFAIAALIAIGSARAQCPANPLTALSGTWAFLSEDGEGTDAAIGFFSASIGTSSRGVGAGAPIGVLNGTTTYSVNHAFPEQGAALIGSFTLNPDCSGGLLYFNLSNQSYQYQFVFVNGNTKMYFVSAGGTGTNTSFGPAFGDRGQAVLLPGAPSCAGVTQPLNLLTGNWGFETQDWEGASAGLLAASVGTSTRGTVGVPIGVLSALVTTSGEGVQQMFQEQVAGTYVMNSDCSGGTVSFPSGEANQYAFVFSAYAGGTPTEIYMISTSGISNNTGFFRGNWGIADKQ
jgi:hypothetical protein